MGDQWVAIRPNTNEKSAQSGVDKFIGDQAILDMTYRSGFYYDFINTEAGKDYLIRAGIEDDPYGIFSPSLHHEMKNNMNKTEEKNKTETFLTSDVYRSSQEKGKVPIKNGDDLLQTASNLTPPGSNITESNMAENPTDNNPLSLEVEDTQQLVELNEKI